ncbi:MAG: hypothetical protein Q7R30_00515 [Acidobacteriota bacterium]|nr:hypothetical protein [Acidobacteriota bacterium]
MTRLIVVALAVTAWLTGRASAQSSADSFQVGAQLTVARSGQFDSTELGIGGRVSWHPIALVGIESEIGPSFADGFTLRDTAFFSHDFRVSFGGGLRF